MKEARSLHPPTCPINERYRGMYMTHDRRTLKSPRMPMEYAESADLNLTVEWDAELGQDHSEIVVVVASDDSDIDEIRDGTYEISYIVPLLDEVSREVVLQVTSYNQEVGLQLSNQLLQDRSQLAGLDPREAQPFVLQRSLTSKVQVCHDERVVIEQHRCACRVQLDVSLDKIPFAGHGLVTTSDG